MARPKAERTNQAKQELVRIIKSGYFGPGERFLSTRSIARRFDLSIQTAQNISKELLEEGLVVRTVGSGTYVSGEQLGYKAVELIIHPLARQHRSFGAVLRTEILRNLFKYGLQAKTIWTDHFQQLSKEHFPIIRSCPRALAQVIDEGRHGLLIIDETIPSEVSGSMIDIFSEDNYAGGRMAAEIFNTRFPGCRTAVLCGPRPDHRGKDRTLGFLSVFPNAPVLYAESWYPQAAYTKAEELYPLKPECVFCVSDRMAEGLIDRYARDLKPRPRVIGYGNAPVSESLNFTTLAISHEEMCAIAARVANNRCSGEFTSPLHRVFTPRPIIRGF